MLSGNLIQNADRLFDSVFLLGHRAGIKGQFLVKTVDERFRKYHVADPHGRRERFREGVDVDDAFQNVNVLQSRNRLAGHAELTVIVVFDDIPVRRFGCPAQQLVAPADGHDDAGGKMV